MPLTRSMMRGWAAALAVLLVAGLSIAFFPKAAYAAAPQLDYQGTHEVGVVNRVAVVDDARQRVYTTVNPAPMDTTPGAIAWYDLKTGAPAAEQIQLNQPQPTDVVLSADGKRLYVTHNQSSILSVVDIDSGSVTEISGVPDWSSGLVEDTDSGLVYVFDSDGLVEVDPDKGTASEMIPVSGEKYPLVKDVVYDSTSHMLWIAEGRKKVITGYSTITHSWMESISIPVADFVVDEAPVGGRPSILAMDEELGELHVAVLPTLTDNWTNAKVLSLRVKDGLFVGSPIEVGENVYEMTVNPATHEVLTTNGFDNTVSVISPDTWLASTPVDFNAAGVTEGTGSGWADTWGIGVTGDGTQAFVSHPYSDRLSVLKREGDVPTPTQREVAPGQDEKPETPENGPWEGPAAPEPSAAPEGAQQSSDGTLTWAINEYMQAWAPSALGTAAKDGTDYRFSGARGWYDVETGTADVVWDGGILIQHYPGMVPTVKTTLGNPRLQIASDGTGTLSFDVAWNLYEDVNSDGYKRVTLATFSNAAVTQDGDAVTITATPDYAGRQLTLDGRTYPDSYPADFVEWLNPEMRAWWVTTGASMDGEKPPLPFTATLALKAADDSGTDDGGSDDGQGTPGAGDDGATGGNGSTGGTAARAGDDGAGSSSTALPITGATLLPWIIGAVVLVVLALLAFLLSARSRKKRQGEQASSEPPAQE